MWTKQGFTITCDRAAVDRKFVTDFLASSYWAKNVPSQVVDQSIDHSLCFSLLDGKGQVGFARVITDYARIAHLADVFVLPPYRGQGLGGWLVTCVLAHPDLQSVRRWTLATEDAHDFYRRFGFTPLEQPGVYMERLAPEST